MAVPIMTSIDLHELITLIYAGDPTWDELGPKLSSQYNRSVLERGIRTAAKQDLFKGFEDYKGFYSDIENPHKGRWSPRDMAILSAARCKPYCAATIARSFKCRPVTTVESKVRIVDKEYKRDANLKMAAAQLYGGDSSLVNALLSHGNNTGPGSRLGGGTGLGGDNDSMEDGEGHGASAGPGRGQRATPRSGSIHPGPPLRSASVASSVKEEREFGLDRPPSQAPVIKAEQYGNHDNNSGGRGGSRIKKEPAPSKPSNPDLGYDFRHTSGHGGDEAAPEDPSLLAKSERDKQQSSEQNNDDDDEEEAFYARLYSIATTRKDRNESTLFVTEHEGDGPNEETLSTSAVARSSPARDASARSSSFVILPSAGFHGKQTSELSSDKSSPAANADASTEDIKPKFDMLGALAANNLRTITMNVETSEYSSSRKKRKSKRVPTENRGQTEMPAVTRGGTGSNLEVEDDFAAPTDGTSLPWRSLFTRPSSPIQRKRSQKRSASPAEGISVKKRVRQAWGDGKREKSEAADEKTKTERQEKKRSRRIEIIDLT